MDVKIKKLHPTASIPTYAKLGDAGLDLTAISRRVEKDTTTGTKIKYIQYGTGIAVEIPEGYVGLVYPRSSISKTDLILSNCVGVIDSGYRGEIICRFKSTQNMFGIYEVGDRVAQLVIIPYPQINLVEVDELSESERGTGAFGSTEGISKKLIK